MLDHGIKPWLLPRADAPRAELMGLAGRGADEAHGKSSGIRFVALAYVPARRRHNGGRPDPEGDLIA